MQEEHWTSIIRPKKNLFSIDFRDIWNHRDLLFLFVKRDFIAVYKQTILGPLWFFIEPALTTIIFTVIFGMIAGLETGGDVPHPVFYLAGLTMWNYFAECLRKTSDTFIENQHIFGKVYFPRLISPLSVVISSLIKYGIQFILFLGVYIYYLASGEYSYGPNVYALLLPVYILFTGIMALGIGMIISSLTSRYRDLRFLILFGIQLWMYASPIIYPLSGVEGKLKSVLMLNPMTGIIESFKYSFFGQGVFSPSLLAYSCVFALAVFLIATVVFNKTEQNFMDTV